MLEHIQVWGGGQGHKWVTDETLMTLHIVKRWWSAFHCGISQWMPLMGGVIWKLYEILSCNSDLGTFGIHLAELAPLFPPRRTGNKTLFKQLFLKSSNYLHSTNTNTSNTFTPWLALQQSKWNSASNIHKLGSASYISWRQQVIVQL